MLFFRLFTVIDAHLDLRFIVSDDDRTMQRSHGARDIFRTSKYNAWVISSWRVLRNAHGHGWCTIILNRAGDNTRSHSEVYYPESVRTLLRLKKNRKKEWNGMRRKGKGRGGGGGEGGSVQLWLGKSGQALLRRWLNFFVVDFLIHTQSV